MAQAVSRRPLTTKTRVRTRVSQYGICGGQNGTGADFSPSSSVCTCQYHSTLAVHTHISPGDNNRLVGGGMSETLSHPIDMNTNKIACNYSNTLSTCFYNLALAHVIVALFNLVFIGTCLKT
jgi:hypothetical protein